MYKALLHFSPCRNSVYLIFFLIFASSSFIAWSEVPYRLTWAVGGGGSNTDGASDVSILPDGSQFVVGSFRVTAAFRGIDGASMTRTAVGNADGFLARYAADGRLQWVRTVGGTGYDSLDCVATLPSGGCAVLASIQGTARFDAGTPQEATLTVPARGLVLAFYDANGVLTGFSHAECTGLIQGHRVARGPDGSLWATGYLIGSAVFGPGEAHETQVGPGGGFLARFEANGNLAWAKSVGANGIDVVPLPDGTAWAAGAAVAPATFGAGEPNQVVWDPIPPYSNSGRYLSHYAADGTLLGHKRIPGSWPTLPPEAGHAIRVAPGDNGSLLVCGAFSSRTVLALGEPNETVLNLGTGLQNVSDIFLAKLSASGTLLWSKRLGGVYSDVVWNLTSFADGRFLVTGSIAGGVVFGEGEPTETTVATHSLGNDIFVALYQPDGSFSEVVVIGGQSMEEEALGMAIAPDESIRLAGSYTTQIIFHRNVPGQKILNSAGGRDLFVARVDRLAPPGSVSPQWSPLPLVALPGDSGMHASLMNLHDFASDASTPPDLLTFSVVRESNPEIVHVSTTLDGVVSATVQPGRVGRSGVVFRVSNPFGLATDAAMTIVVGSTGVPEVQWQALK